MGSEKHRCSRDTSPVLAATLLTNACLQKNPGSLDLPLILELHLFWEPSRVLCQSAKKEAEL